MKFFVPFIFAICCAFVSNDPPRYTIVFLNKNPNAPVLTKEEADKVMQGHTESRETLAKEGKLLAAGPFEGGGGLYILKTASLEEARSWISNDPGVQGKRWTLDIYTYQPRHNGVCPAKEPYEMVAYTLVRFEAVVNKTNAQTQGELMMQHDAYLRKIIATGNTVTEGIFGAREGGVLIVKGELQKELIEADPAVQQGLIRYQIKKFYTAKGSFCEQ